jgi:hypothetical protein
MYAGRTTSSPFPTGILLVRFNLGWSDTTRYTVLCDDVVSEELNNSGHCILILVGFPPFLEDEDATSQPCEFAKIDTMWDLCFM